MCFSTHPSCTFAQADKMCNVFQEAWAKDSFFKCWNYSILMLRALIRQDYGFPKQWWNQTINTKNPIYRCIFLMSATSESDFCLVFFADCSWVTLLFTLLDFPGTWIRTPDWNLDRKMSSSLTVRKYSIVCVPSTWRKWAHVRLGWLASQKHFLENLN